MTLAVVSAAGAWVRPRIEVAGQDHLLTSAGPLHRSSPVVRQALDILYPGYAAPLAALEPALFERAQFSRPTLLLDGDRQVRVQVPWRLPFRLAAAQAPEIVVFGSSRAREGIRPDVLAAELGGARVLNMAVSGAAAETIEILFDALFGTFDGQVKAVVVLIDDIAFTEEFRQNVPLWRGQVKELDKAASVQGRVAAWGRAALDRLPRLRRPPPADPIADFRRCDDPSPVRQAALASMDAPYPWHLSPEAAAAFARVVAKAQARAQTVVLVETPVTDVEKARARLVPYLQAARAGAGRLLIEGPPEAWGLTFEDYLGAEGKGACEFDSNHVNPKAAFTMTRHLAGLIRARMAS